jgi:hypothetical protein
MAHKIDVFDAAYRDRIRYAALKAIMDASIDPTTNIAALRNHEIYDAPLDLQAMILATSKDMGSPTKMRETADQFSKKLRRRITEFKAEYDKNGPPFPVLHTDEMQ